MGLTLPPDDPRNPKKKKPSNLADGRMLKIKQTQGEPMTEWLVKGIEEKEKE
jgi:hypothetical protein